MEISDNKTVEYFIEKLPSNLIKFHLTDLRQSEDSLCIRIWKQHEILTLNFKGTPYCNEKIFVYDNGEPIIKDINYSDNILDSIYSNSLINNLFELKGAKRTGIDGYFIFFEISTPNLYKAISYWSPKNDNEDSKKALQILDLIYNTLGKNINRKSLYSYFFNSLKPGGYGWGMSNIQVDYFPENIKKTDFYLFAESEIRKELNITDITSHLNYPLVIINSVPSFIAQLNNYEQKDIESFVILKPDTKELSLYGIHASRNGVVILKTKNTD